MGRCKILLALRLLLASAAFPTLVEDETHAIEELQEAKEEFDSIDANHDGFISREEINGLDEVPESDEVDEFFLHYDTDKVVSGVFRLSTKRNPIGVKFATGPRTYNDAEEKERKAKPGPGQYKLNSAMGTQVSSRYKSQPIITFGAR